MIKALADLHIERKLTHVLGILAMVVAHHFLSLETCWWILLCLGVPLLLFDFFRQKVDFLHKLSVSLFGAIMRRRELHGYTGTTYLIIGTAILLALCPHDIVALSLLFVAFGDPLASFVGLKFGSLKIVGKKTLEGSLAAYAVCALLAYMFYSWKMLMLEHIYIVTLLSGLVGAVSEILPLFKLDDNLVQPVVNGGLLYLLFYLYGGL